MLLFHTLKHALIENFGHFCAKFEMRGCFFHANYKEVTAHGR